MTATLTIDEFLGLIDTSDLPRPANRTGKYMDFRASKNLHKDAFLIHASLIEEIQGLGLEEGDFYLVQDCISFPNLGINFYCNTEGQLIGELTRVEGTLNPTRALETHPEGHRTRHVIAPTPQALHVDDGSWMKILALINALFTV